MAMAPPVLDGTVVAYLTLLALDLHRHPNFRATYPNSRRQRSQRPFFFSEPFSSRPHEHLSMPLLFVVDDKRPTRYVLLPKARKLKHYCLLLHILSFLEWTENNLPTYRGAIFYPLLLPITVHRLQITFLFLRVVNVPIICLLIALINGIIIVSN